METKKKTGLLKGANNVTENCKGNWYIGGSCPHAFFGFSFHHPPPTFAAMDSRSHVTFIAEVLHFNLLSNNGDDRSKGLLSSFCQKGN